MARPHDLPWASGRTALVRFPAAERVRWHFPSRSDAPLELWLRYAAAREVPVRWSIDGDPMRETRVPPTGAFEGRDAWGWALLGTLGAGDGERTLSLAGAALRPDCFLLQSPGLGAPGWPPTPAPPEHAPAVLEALRSAEPRAEATWLTESARLSLPAWLETTRVGLHTRLSVAWTDRPVFTRAEQAAASLGAPAIVRHVKSMRGECFWSSAHGAVAGWVEGASVDGEDPVAAMARRAHDNDLAFVAYYRHQEDRPLAREHPDWVCRDAWGRTIRRSGEPRLCFHSPFAELTSARLLELAQRGADGIYLDESHQPIEGCWCDWTRAAFERETGLPLPPAPLLEDPLYRRFLAFMEDSLARELTRWRETLSAREGGCVLLVSTHRQPEGTDPWPTLRLASVGHAAKTEFASGAPASRERLLGASTSRDARIALGWAMSRDGAFGRPAHVWVHGLRGPERWRAAVGAIVASGCVANLDHPEQTLPDPESYAEALAFGRELAQPFAGARPLPDVLLHLPERARNAFGTDREAVDGPFLAAWEALLARHRPVRILSDDELASALPAGAQVLFLPNRQLLEESQRATFERFANEGGVVIESDPRRLVAATAGLPLPVALQAPAHVQAHWFRAQDGALVIGLTNAPAWIDEPNAGAPEPVVDARLSLLNEVRAVTVWPGGRRLPLPSGRAARELRLPSFENAVVLRIEL